MTSPTFHRASALASLQDHLARRGTLTPTAQASLDALSDTDLCRSLWRYHVAESTDQRNDFTVWVARFLAESHYTPDHTPGPGETTLGDVVASMDHVRRDEVEDIRAVLLQDHRSGVPGRLDARLAAFARVSRATAGTGRAQVTSNGSGAICKSGLCPLHNGTYGNKPDCPACCGPDGVPLRPDTLSEESWADITGSRVWQDTFDPSSRTTINDLLEDIHQSHKSATIASRLDWYTEGMRAHRDTFADGGTLRYPEHLDHLSTVGKARAFEEYSRGWNDAARTAAGRLNDDIDETDEDLDEDSAGSDAAQSAPEPTTSPVHLYTDRTGTLVRSVDGPHAVRAQTRNPQGGLIPYRPRGPLTPATAEQIADAGRASGVCMVCGRALQDASSVAAGIGRTCQGKIGGR